MQSNHTSFLGFLYDPSHDKASYPDYPVIFLKMYEMPCHVYNRPLCKGGSTLAVLDTYIPSYLPHPRTFFNTQN